MYEIKETSIILHYLCKITTHILYIYNLEIKCRSHLYNLFLYQIYSSF